MNDLIRIHNIVCSTKALGPGERAAIWFQGCQRSCPGCMSPETRPTDKGKFVRIKDIVDLLKRLEGIEGITISGGEPFLQKSSLYTLLKELRENTKLGVIIYTGYTFEELQKMNDFDINEILDGLCDLIIDGEYVEKLNDGKRFKGSSNQRLIFVTDRYRDYRYLYEEDNRSVEVIVKSGEMYMYGIPDKDTLKRWQKYQKKQGE